MQKLRALWADEEKRHLVLAAISGIALACDVFGWRGGLPFAPAWVAIVLCGFPILRGAAVGLVTRFDIKADVLVAIALVAAVVIGELFAAGEVAFIMALGSWLEERTVRKAREGIEKLVSLTPGAARVLRDGEATMVPIDSVRVGDTVRVLPGESLPVDGVIVFGRTAIDQSLVTGESLPVDKESGDAVHSGTVNQFGAFDMRVTRVGEDSAVQRMIRLVESADADKAPIVRIMDRWATWIVVAALLTALGVWIGTGEVIRAVTILVVFCPCALVLATPTAIMAGIGNATRHGVLIASGDALERLARVDTIAFDKTGTLTNGRPEVVELQALAPGLSQMDLLRLAAGVEQHSEHPLGLAVLRHARACGLPGAGQGIGPERVTAVPGRGMRAVVDGVAVLGGNARFMAESGVPLPEAACAAVARHEAAGRTVIYIARDGVAAGLVALADTLRPDAVDTVRRLHAAGVRTALLTGDHAQAARHIAAEAGIDVVQAELLPEDKVAAMGTMRRAGRTVCMVGDGINDAPALKSADVSFAMGGVGSDIAVDAADGVLVHDDIRRLPYLVRLARQVARTIVVNISLSMFLNALTVLLAALGLMGPVLGALAHNAGALLIVLNSTRLLRFTDAATGRDAYN